MTNERANVSDVITGSVDTGSNRYIPDISNNESLRSTTLWRRHFETQASRRFAFEPRATRPRTTKQVHFLAADEWNRFPIATRAKTSSRYGISFYDVIARATPTNVSGLILIFTRFKTLRGLSACWNLRQRNWQWDVERNRRIMRRGIV